MFFKIFFIELLIAGALTGIGYFLSKKKGKIDRIELIIITISTLIWSTCMFYTYFADKLIYPEYRYIPGAIYFSDSSSGYFALFSGTLFLGIFLYLTNLTIKHFSNPKKKYDSLLLTMPESTTAKKNIIFITLLFIAGFIIHMLANSKFRIFDGAAILMTIIVSVISIGVLRWRRSVRKTNYKKNNDPVPVTSWKKLSVATMISLMPVFMRLYSYFIYSQNKYETINNGLGVLQYLSISALLTVATARIYRTNQDAD